MGNYVCWESGHVCNSMIWFLVWNIQRPFIVKPEITLIQVFAWFPALSMHHRDRLYHQDEDDDDDV